MATNIAFVLSAVTLVATGYGVPAGTAPYARAYLQGQKLTHALQHKSPRAAG